LLDAIWLAARRIKYLMVLTKKSIGIRRVALLLGEWHKPEPALTDAAQWV
jgi:hypothetical protein